MFYIVRVWENGTFCDYEYDGQEDAKAHLMAAEGHAEMYVWPAGHEMFMESNGR